MESSPITLFSDIFADLSPELSGRTAICCGGAACTYGQLSAAVDRYAVSLLQDGVRPGEHVGLWSFNSIEWVAAFFAIVKVGAVAVLLNYSLSAQEVEALLRRADVSYLFCGNNAAVKRDPQAAEKLVRTVGLRRLVDLRTAENAVSGCCSIPADAGAALADRVAADNADRSAYIIFTTGTTGAPKPVLLHQRGLLLNAASLDRRTASITGDTICIALPLFHVFGLQWLTTYLLRHKTVYLQDRIQAGPIIETVSANRIRDIASVGTIYAQLTAHPEFSKVRDLLRFCQTGGGRITPSQFLKLEDSFSDAVIFNGLGMTEAHGGVTEPLPTDSRDLRSRTLGPLGETLEGKFISPEGDLAAPGTVGELCLRGQTLMNGYYGRPADQQGFDAEGWFHTGDLGYFDEHGYICLTGRTKEIIIRCGENIAPVEIETAIIDAGGVRDAKVYGIPHPVLGESVECCLVPEDPAHFDAAALRDTLQRQLASFKIPEHFILFDDFPLQSNGKIDDRALRQALEARLRAEL